VGQRLGAHFELVLLVLLDFLEVLHSALDLVHFFLLFLELLEDVEVGLDFLGTLEFLVKILEDVLQLHHALVHALEVHVLLLQLLLQVHHFRRCRPLVNGGKRGTQRIPISYASVSFLKLLFFNY